jgi:acetylornithine aminotransferase
MKRLLFTYDPLPVTFTRGEGVWLWDEKGNRYLDAISGIGINLLGHENPEWVSFVQQQAAKLVHVSNLYQIPEKELLAEVLCHKTGMDKAFFANSGSEANECAIKLARLYGHRKHFDNPSILVFENAFHGRTLATLTASGHRQVQAGFEPLASGFARAPFNDMNALKQIANTRNDIVAVMVEPIQGAGGINVASEQFLREIRQLCNKHDWLMIVDEIQTGMGRTGKFLYCDHLDIKPDILTLSKGLANGIPIGVCLTKGIANELFAPDKHGSTSGGNPFACAVALQTLGIIDKYDLMNNASIQGENLLKALREQFQHHPLVKSVRGKGLMIGIELNKPCKEISKISLQQGLLVNVIQHNIIRLLPPLVIQSQEVAYICEKLNIVLKQFETEP